MRPLLVMIVLLAFAVTEPPKVEAACGARASVAVVNTVTAARKVVRAATFPCVRASFREGRLSRRAALNSACR